MSSKDVSSTQDAGWQQAATRWFSSPAHADEEATRVARVVHVIGLGMSVAMLASAVHNVIAREWISVVVLVAEQLLVVGCMVLNQKGAFRLASRLLVLSAVGFTAGLALVGQHGSHDVSVLIYPVVIVAAGALFDRRWLIALTGVVMTLLAIQYVLEISGAVRYQETRFTELRTLVDAEFILVVSALLVGLLMGSLRESVERSRAALLSLGESEDLYRTLFESVYEAILIHEPRTGAIVDANRRASELFGHSSAELRALSIAEISSNIPGYTQQDAMAYIALTMQGQPQFFEWQSRARDERIFWVEINMRYAVVAGEPRVLASLRDIDERKRMTAARQHLEEQLRQSQRLESLGRLAGGVAHDFNNLLMCISGNVELALAGTAPHLPVAQNLAEIQDAARRAAELTRRLLAFSRKQPIEPRPLDLRNLLGSLCRMLKRLLGEEIELRTEVAADLCQINADPSQVEQILVNLTVNAKDAMPKGGQLTIVAENVTIDQAFCATRPAAIVGNYVHICVQDDGSGMGEEVLRHVFEPFFTTKAAGKGTGLGLAMVFGAVQQNHGFVEVHSELGRGSAFDVYFPAFFGDVVPALSESADVPYPRGCERVLLVEDDASVRHISERILAELGYRVVACASGAEAIGIVEREGPPFDLLVTDVILPGIDGRMLATRLLAAQPTLRVLYCSGYTADVIAHRGVIDHGITFLSKPFTVDELARKVRAVLDVQ
jgi:two-component system, cell cycle sensor histidine kinase and response regulator CckA